MGMAVAEAVHWGFPVDFVMDLPLTSIGPLVGDITELKYQAKIEDFYAVMGAVRGDPKKVENDVVKPWRKRLRASQKVASGKELAEKINRPKPRKRRGPPPQKSLSTRPQKKR